MADANAAPKKYANGTLVYLTRSKLEGPQELLTILWDIEPDEDEPENMPKYLTRTATHSKKVVFHCEVMPAVENRESSPPIPSK